MTVKLKDSYDWLVLGDHPGALLCGALVAKLGLSVLMLPFGKDFEAKKSKQGPILDPDSSYFIGLTDALGYTGLLSRCLKRIEMTVPQAELAGPLVVTPSFRVEFAGELPALKDAILREMGDELARKLGFVEALEVSEGAFLQFWSGLPESLTIALQPPKSRRRVGMPRTRSLDALADVSRSDRYAKPWFEPRPMDFGAEARELLSGLWSALCASGGSEDFRMRDLLTVFALSRTGGFWPGGRAELVAALKSRARALGAHFPAQAECSRIFIEGGRITGVQLSQKDQVISILGAAVGAPMRHVSEVAALSGSQLFSRMKTPPTPSGWKFTLAVSVPERMKAVTGPWMHYKEKGAPSIDCEFRDIADGRCSLNMRTVLPYDAKTLDPEYQRLIGARMYRQVAELLPGLLELDREPNAEIYPDFRPEIKPGRQPDSPYLFEGLDAIPDDLLVYEGAGMGSRSGVEGLFSVSTESYPELGSLGGVVAAIEAAAWIAHRNGIVGPFA